jgi:hypothetical protein
MSKWAFEPIWMQCHGRIEIGLGGLHFDGDTEDLHHFGSAGIGLVAAARKLCRPLCALGHIFQQANQPSVGAPSLYGVSP